MYSGKCWQYVLDFNLKNKKWWKVLLVWIKVNLTQNKLIKDKKSLEKEIKKINLQILK